MGQKAPAPLQPPAFPLHLGASAARRCGRSELTELLTPPVL